MSDHELHTGMRTEGGEVVAGNGYQLIKPGDLLRPGDEYTIDNGDTWHKYQIDGLRQVQEGEVVRRVRRYPVRVGSRHRQLIHTERLSPGDEYWDSHHGMWRPIAGITIGYSAMIYDQVRRLTRTPSELYTEDWRGSEIDGCRPVYGEEITRRLRELETCTFSVPSGEVEPRYVAIDELAHYPSLSPVKETELTAGDVGQSTMTRLERVAAGLEADPYVTVGRYELPWSKIKDPYDPDNDPKVYGPDLWGEEFEV